MVNDYTGMHIGDLVVLEQMEPVAGKQNRRAWGNSVRFGNRRYQR